jgi:hypothetical protein
VEESGCGLIEGIILEEQKNHEKPQPGLPVSGPRFGPETSRIRSRIVNNSTTPFDLYFYECVIPFHELIVCILDKTR